MQHNVTECYAGHGVLVFTGGRWKIAHALPECSFEGREQLASNRHPTPINGIVAKAIINKKRNNSKEKQLRKAAKRSSIMEQAPVQIGQFILGKNLGIGAFGKVCCERLFNLLLQ